MQRLVLAALAALLANAPFGARGADLIVWWEKTHYAQADAAVREIVTAFEQETGKQVDLVQPRDEIMGNAMAAVQAGAPPDFLYSEAIDVAAARWAYDDRLVDLGDALGPVLDLFDADALDVATEVDGKTGRRGLYALPMGRTSNYVQRSSRPWRWGAPAGSNAFAACRSRRADRQEYLPRDWRLRARLDGHRGAAGTSGLAT